MLPVRIGGVLEAMSLSTLLIGHVVHERRLHQDLIAAGQSNLVELKNWEWFVWDFTRAFPLA